LRGDIFETHRQVAVPGDWWCRLDADEIYIDNPKSILPDVARFGFVLSATYNFYFTDADLSDYTKNPSGWSAAPVQDRLKYYQNNWSEGRFVRHRKNLVWGGHIWPPNRGRTAPVRMRLKHYQYRSPEQIARRLLIRQGKPAFLHESNRSLAVPSQADADWANKWLETAEPATAVWTDRIRPAAECDLYRGDGEFVAHEELMPRLPSATKDRVRASLQATALGRAMLSPVIQWRKGKREKTPSHRANE
jgi:hypothetical protein